MRTKQITLTLLAAGLLLATAAQARLVDDFDSRALFLAVSEGADWPVWESSQSDSPASAGITGGYRDVWIAIDEPGTTLPLDAEIVVSIDTLGLFTVSNQAQVDSSVVLDWDGDDLAPTGTDGLSNPRPTVRNLSTGGLVGVDLTDGGISDQFRIAVYLQDGDFDFTLTVYEGASSVSFTGNTGPAFYTPADVFVRMTDFAGGTATLADFDNVTAVTLEIDTGFQARDFIIDSIDTTTLCTGTIGDFVWNDLDRDGIQDPGEPGIEDVEVTIVRDDGTLSLTTQTGPGGSYEFGPLCAGDYTVTVNEATLPPGFVPSPPFADDGSANPDARDSNASPALVNLPNDDTDDPTIDFGYNSPCTGRIGNFVWHDLDRDGIQDAGEPGIEGVTVQLLDSSGTQLLATTSTGPNGFYSFDGVCAGEYLVEVDEATLPAGFVASPSMVGTDPAADSDGSPAIAVLPDDVSENLTIDFGYNSPCTGEIGDRVWFDEDRDGIQDPGEPGIAGVTVVLLDATGAQVGTTTTGTDGSYLFSGLCAGDYRVVVDEGDLPPEYEPSPSLVGTDDTVDSNGSPADVTLPADDTSERTIDFGYNSPCTGRIGDFVWLDEDGDGLQGPGESGIGGVRVILRNALQQKLAETTTAPDGSYLFDGLCAGDYRVEIDPATLPAGLRPTLVQAGPADEDNNGSPAAVTLPGDFGEDLTIDFGYVEPAPAIDVEKATNGEDADDPTGPAILVGEPVEWTYVVTNTGDIDLADVVVTDDKLGEICTIASLPVGGSETCTASGGAEAGQYRNLAEASGQPVDDGTPVGERVTDEDPSHYIGQEPASLGDLVFEDLNADGIQDAGEPGIGGVTVTLREPGDDGVCAADDTAIATTTTAADGSYGFAGLAPGEYCVTFETPAGLTASPRQQGGDPAKDSDGTASDVVTLASGANDPTIDAGFFAPASLGDFVFRDLNGDGIQDAGEPGIGGVTVTLREPGEDGVCAAGDTVIGTTTTAADGSYGFAGLDPGEYCVTFETPDGFTASPRQQGGDPAKDSDGTASDVVTLASGANDPTIDAGFFAPASLGDFVFRDLNADGIQDAGEPGIGGVTVTLREPGDDGACAADDAPIGTTTTAADGSYAFTGLNPGDYCVTFATPAGLTASPRQQGGDPAQDSDGTVSDLVTLASGADDPTIDAGFFGKASLGDLVFEDLNADGIQDAGEPGIGGVTVTLREPGDDGVCDAGDTPIGTTSTAGDGSYAFTGLNPGDYCVTFETPAGFTASPRQQGGDPAKDSDGTASDVVSLASGGNDPTIDAGFFRPASLGDFVFEDLNADGIQGAGEPGIGGVTVTLREPGDDGACDAGDAVIGTTMTAGNGSYAFTGLNPGAYCVTFAGPAGWNASPRQQGGDPARDSDGPASNPVTLESGEDDPTLDAGFYLPAPAVDVEKATNGADADNPSGPLVLVGNPVTWTYVVTNTGNLTLVDLRVSDDKLGDICTIPSLAVGASETCSAGGTAVSGQYANLATAVGNPVDGAGAPAADPVSDQDPSHYLGVTPAIDIRKQAEGQDSRTFPSGSDVTFEILVTNTGDVPLANVAVTDAQVPGCAMSIGDLAVGESRGYSCTDSSVTASYVNEACVAGDALGVRVSDCDPSIVEILPGGGGICPPNIHWDQFPAGTVITDQVPGVLVSTDRTNQPAMIFDSANPTGGDRDLGSPNEDFGGPGRGNGGEAGQPGENRFALGKILIISEDGDSNDPDDDAGGGVLYFSFAQPVRMDRITLLDVETHETATVRTYDGAGNLIGEVSGNGLGDNGYWPFPVLADNVSHMEIVLSGSGSVPNVDFCLDEGQPAIDVRKQAEGPDSRTFEAGATVPFEIAVTNTGDVDLTGVLLSDPLVPACERTIGALAVGETVSWQCSVLLGSGAGGTRTYRDEFGERRYDNNDGTHDFSGPWVEHDVAGSGPTSGNVLVGDNHKLWLDDYPDTGTDPNAARTADLAGAVSATLRFDWSTHDGVDKDDKVVVEISSDGGASYTELDAFTGFSGSKSGHEEYDISAYASAQTTVRFRVAHKYGGSNETFKVDNLTIAAEIGAGAEGFVNEACASGDGAGRTVEDCDTSEVVVETGPVGGQGCTPGYWKQPQHYFAWTPPYQPDTPFGAVFEDAFPGMTLVEVAAQGGGDLKALGRHTVAALLNAASGEVDYDIAGPQDVIDRFNAVYPGSKDDYNALKDLFEGYNEQGCPLGNDDGGGAAPAIDIRKQAEGPDSRTFEAGATVPFEIAVTNTGDVDLSGVVVSDPLVPACDQAIGDLAAGESLRWECSVVLEAGGGTRTYRDEFGERRYDNNDGTHDFSGPWVEHDVAGSGPTSGNVLVGDNHKLWLDDYPDTGTDPSAARTADLAGAVSATLRFDWYTHDGVDHDDKVVVEISSDGGASYTELDAFTGFSGSKSRHEEYDISAYASAQTTVRFRVAHKYGGSNETFKVDNLTIAADGGGAVGFVNEACVTGAGDGETVGDCDTSEVVVAAGGEQGGDGGGAPVALLVVGSDSGDGDAEAVDRLAYLGFEVRTQLDERVDEADAEAADLVVVSSTVQSGKVGTRLRHVAVPVLLWESWLYDDMGMTGGRSGSDYGSDGNEKKVTVVSGHPLAAGLGGTPHVYGKSLDTHWGMPRGEVEVAVVDDARRFALVFGYEAGAEMDGMSAPARRVGFFLDDDTAKQLTHEGWMLFDAAVLWAAGY